MTFHVGIIPFTLDSLPFVLVADTDLDDQDLINCSNCSDCSGLTDSSNQHGVHKNEAEL